MSSFSDAPMFFKEDAEARLKQLQRDDPIAWQDAVNTSRALVESVKDNDIEELRRVVANADEGELIQAFTIQSFVMALKASSLEMVQQFVDWGMPLQSPSLSQVLHLVCELVNRENFSSSWRILKVLAEGNCYGALDINTPRSSDGWTPLCIACGGACLPLAFKLLELKADPNVITRSNETPLSIVKRSQPDDDEEQIEARGIISNMLHSYGAQDNYRDVLRISRKQAKEMNMAPVSEPMKSHTRYRG